MMIFLLAGRVKVEPFTEAMVQPSSVDVRLDRFFRVFENHKYEVIDPSKEQSELTREVAVAPNEFFILHPGEFVLASTYEVITLPDDIAGRLEGKSSLGRLGLLTHLFIFTHLVLHLHMLHICMAHLNKRILLS